MLQCFRSERRAMCICIHTHQTANWYRRLQLWHSRGDSHQTSSTLTRIHSPAGVPSANPPGLSFSFHVLFHVAKPHSHPVTFLTSSDSRGAQVELDGSTEESFIFVSYVVWIVPTVLVFFTANVLSMYFCWSGSIYSGNTRAERDDRWHLDPDFHSALWWIHASRRVQYCTEVSSTAGGAHFMDNIRCQPCRLARIAADLVLRLIASCWQTDVSGSAVFSQGGCRFPHFGLDILHNARTQSLAVRNLHQMLWNVVYLCYIPFSSHPQCAHWRCFLFPLILFVL